MAKVVKTSVLLVEIASVLGRVPAMATKMDVRRPPAHKVYQ